MKRSGIGFRIAQGGTLSFAAAALVFVVVQAQGGCKSEVTAEPDPATSATSRTGSTTGSGSRAEADATGEPERPAVDDAAPTADATEQPAAAAKPPTKPGGAKPAPPHLKPEGTFFPSSKAGPMPNFVDEPAPNQAPQAQQGKK